MAGTMLFSGGGVKAFSDGARRAIKGATALSQAARDPCPQGGAPDAKRAPLIDGFRGRDV
ncbi:hypothetical protein K9U39_03550 [Rhodoblastus acidophilus]|uniref:Uncharacterized protein n=1 Tax=Candidatus Rhodoblastus alkanivorans TaxID=2954117 RepID=A0ABS9Z5R6_9HYPH|nr:hypothetical protein [Candidatus Rhodoblastus alkanivorans]MCI4679872.1 hypothetical protein [Candidatus Rhodoblastus alkanivorans]MCI4682725.1 hypothetical protein [Candidatus Rhodoblastus alkanivorans]MDI4640032.1 hypothetical protein [Rhodoblastus acidophilus]